MTDKTQEKKRPFRKIGKTLLVKAFDDTKTVDKKDLTKKNLPGLLSLVKVENKNVSYFLTFEDTSKSADALKKLRGYPDNKYFVKAVHYQVFFKCDELEGVSTKEQLEHNDLKLAFRKFIQENTNSTLLWPPKVFSNKEKNTYMNCGFITIDTKDGLDALLSEDKFKNAKLNSGNEDAKDWNMTFYRYRAKRDEKQNDNENVDDE